MPGVDPEIEEVGGIHTSKWVFVVCMQFSVHV